MAMAVDGPVTAASVKKYSTSAVVRTSWAENLPSRVADARNSRLNRYMGELIWKERSGGRAEAYRQAPVAYAG